MAYKEFLHEHIISDHLLPVTVTSENLKTVHMKLLIWKGIVQFRFGNKKYIGIFNKCAKNFIFVSKGIDIKMTYYYSAWITQTLNFGVSEVISWLFK